MPPAAARPDKEPRNGGYGDTLQKRFNFGKAGSLFNRKTVNRAFTKIVFDPTDEQRKAASHWATQVRHPNFKKIKEEAVRSQFIQNVLITILGYTPYRADDAFTVAEEEQLGNGSVDTALGEFSAVSRTIHAPFELKGPKTDDLDVIMPGRNKSPVQQAWEYAIDAPGAKWVLVSNCAEIRLYAFGHGREHYEAFDLGLLDDPKEHERLWLLLGAKFLLTGRTTDLLAQSAIEQKDITNKLYVDYKTTRDTLIKTLQDQPPRLAPLVAIEHAQTILDRVLFVAFAEGTALLPERLIYEAWTRKSPFRSNGAWENFVGLFEAVDKGNPALDIPAYNGGLFAKNAVIDALSLSNFVCENFAKLADYDFASDVSVTVLGHIFEQSVSDIEAMRAEAQGDEPPKTTKTKRDGVVYTPGFVTRFIVEETIGKTLAEKFAAILSAHCVKLAKDGAYDWSKETERDVWRAYRKTLHGLTIIDPACGSGAFLIAAFDYLAAEYKRVGERLAALGDKANGVDVEREILLGNLHGVDLNPEPIEITKLSLWLKTAKRGKLLQGLNANIKCGNSLIEASDEHARPFDWKAEFPEVFAKGGFDIVLGNPPYVRQETIKPMKPYLKEHYKVFNSALDLYGYFYELAWNLTKIGGRFGYISSYTFLKTSSATKLREFLVEKSRLETFIDFGDIKVFDDITTYPVVLISTKLDEKITHDIEFMNLARELPNDLQTTFIRSHDTMPSTDLNPVSWHFESADLRTLRKKLSVSSRPLSEEYGRPKNGIKTGLTPLFELSKADFDGFRGKNAALDQLVKPFVVGDNIEKWSPEKPDRFVIRIERGWTKRHINTDDEAVAWNWFSNAYPEISSRFEGHKTKAKARSDKGDFWWELRSCDYYDAFDKPKICIPEMSQGPKFARDELGYTLNNKVFFLPYSPHLLGYMNSRLAWFYLFGHCSQLRGGQWRLELREQYISTLPIPKGLEQDADLGLKATVAANAADEKRQAIHAVLSRLPDLCPAERVPKISSRLNQWWLLDFNGFRKEIQKAFKADIPLKQRNEWETFVREEGDKVRRLTASIENAEREIDGLVYDLFKLTKAEIALLESSLSGQY